jgi:F0F1-type ATP synthase membrane subunit b/b'
MARDDAIKKLHDETVELATQIASKIIQKELSPADHERLLDESLAALSKVGR